MDNKLLKVFGILLICIGIGYLGNQFGFWHFTIFFKGWWCVLITLFALHSMMTSKVDAVNTFLAILGVYFFLLENNIVQFEASLLMIFSLFLIVVGVKLVFTKDTPNISYEKKQAEFFENTTSFEENKEGTKKIFINSFLSSKRIVESGIVDRCRIENVFGTIYLDLSNADLRTLDALSIDAYFGTVDILVSDDVNLKLSKDKFLSGCYIDSSFTENGYDIFVRGTSIFGTIRITKKKENNV